VAAVDINRSTTGIVLDPEQTGQIWANALTESAVLRLAQRINLPGAGATIDIITGDAAASWVTESDNKPVSRPTFGSKVMTGYTAAVIVPFSNQFRRDKAALYNEVVRRLPAALGRKLDATVFGGDAAPGSNFDTLAAAPEVGISGDTYAGLVAADAAVAANGSTLNGWALSPQARGLLLSGVDTTGRPLFINNIQTDGAVPALLGSPVYTSTAVYRADADGAGAGTDAQLGFAGDWRNAYVGVVEDINLSISDQATLTDGGTQINLWQRNMFAVRAEFEVGFIVRDVDDFVKLTDATQA
jgi:HK97 family phage major capsid protein